MLVVISKSALKVDEKPTFFIGGMDPFAPSLAIKHNLSDSLVNLCVEAFGIDEFDSGLVLEAFHDVDPLNEITQFTQAGTLAGSCALEPHLKVAAVGRASF